jgi:hypothetical protein
VPADVHCLEDVSLPTDGRSGWVGMRSFRLRSPDGKHLVEAFYEGEPPHGDSFHRAVVDGVRLPGFLWGGSFAWNPNSQFLIVSWMAAKFERRTLVIDVTVMAYFALPDYFSDFQASFPVVREVRTAGAASSQIAERLFTFTGNERWTSFGQESST